MNRKNIIITGATVLSAIGLCTAIWEFLTYEKNLKKLRGYAVGYCDYLTIDDLSKRIKYLNKIYNFKDNKDNICILSQTPKKIATYIYYPYLFSLKLRIDTIREDNVPADKLSNLFKDLFFTFITSSLTLIVYSKKENKIVDLHITFFDKADSKISDLLKGKKMVAVNPELFINSNLDFKD